MTKTSTPKKPVKQSMRVRGNPHPTIPEFDNEHEYRKRLCSALFAKGVLTHQHEDRHTRFVPDVSFSGLGLDGWIEIKYCKTAPKTLDDIDHYTAGQQNWLTEFGGAGGGNCYLLVGTPSQHLLISYKYLSNCRSLKLDLVICEIRASTFPALIEAMVKHLRRGDHNRY